MQKACKDFVAICGQPSASSFKPCTATVEVTGVGFFDFLHGQTGVAPNGIELHPMLAIQAVKLLAPPTPVPRSYCSHRASSAAHRRGGSSRQ